MGVTKLVVQQGPVYVYQCTCHGGGPIAVDERRLGLLVSQGVCDSIGIGNDLVW